MTARPSGSTSTGTGHPASRAPTRTPSRRSPPTSGSARKTTATCAAAGLHREITALGYAGSYSAFTRELRGHGITAACGTCRKWKPITPAQARQHYPGPLPFRTAPVAGETIASYLSRAAAASHLPASVITACLPSWFAARAAACDDLAATGQPQPADIRHLAALTGTSETALRHALPALGTRTSDSRPPVRAVLACRRCASRTGQRDPVPVHLPGAPAGLHTAPHLARPRHPDRPDRRPGHHPRLPARFPPRPAARRHQARARRDDRAPAGGRHGRQPARPAARRGARLVQSRPGPGHPDMAEAAAYPETIKLAAAILSDPGELPAGPE